jgi:hypothetical protein
MQNNTNETNTPVEKYLTKEEIGILYNYLKHEYVTYTDEPLYELMKKISEIANTKINGG